VQRAEILVGASLRKSEFINEPCVVKNPSLTVHVIGRTKSLVGKALIATGDTVKITGPGPPHSVAHADGEGIRHKAELVSLRADSHVESLASDIPLSTRNPTSVLIEDADCRNRLNFRRCVSIRRIAGHSWPETHHYQQRC